MDFIETGKIVNTHGVKGEVKIVLWTDDPCVLADFSAFYIDGKEFLVENSRFHKGFLLVKFKGVSSLDEAERLKNKIICADNSLFELEDGEYFFRDLFGMGVYDADTDVYKRQIIPYFSAKVKRNIRQNL